MQGARIWAHVLPWLAKETNPVLPCNSVPIILASQGNVQGVLLWQRDEGTRPVSLTVSSETHYGCQSFTNCCC